MALALALALLAGILVFFLQGVRASEFASEKDRLTTQARLASDNIAFQLAWTSPSPAAFSAGIATTVDRSMSSRGLAW